MPSRTHPPDDWWPDWLRDVADEDPLASDRVVVAEVGGTEGVDNINYRHLYTALAPIGRRNAILRRRGGIGHDVSASGPHPVDYRGTWDYIPRFWVEGDLVIPKGLEPLIVSWQANNRTVLWPDQGFLMTYGLVPRLVAGADTPTMHWDDPEEPRFDVAITKAVSTYSFPAHTEASVVVERDYLQDYATIRGRALIQVYYVTRTGPPTEDIRRLLGAEESVEFRLKGRLLDLRVLPGERDRPILAQVWGVRPLLQPRSAPVSAGRWEGGALTWPGFPNPISDDVSRRLDLFAVAYVRDEVLGLYEGRPGFTIYPESGGVSYGGQWSVGHTRRVGRDLISVELKKLYEGARPEIVRQWHEYAVPPPPGAPVFVQERNVGTRARRIVDAATRLGEAVADMASPVLGRPVSGADIIGLDRTDLRYRGWAAAAHAEPITRHIPRTLHKDGFLGRCDDLYKFIVEGVSEKRLGETLVTLGIPSKDIASIKSLMLLDRLVRLAGLTEQSGLRLDEDRSEIVGRLATEPTTNPLESLFALTRLRQLADHRTGAGGRAAFDGALKVFGVDAAAHAGGWGMALDAVYDRIAETLEQAATTLAAAASSTR